LSAGRRLLRSPEAAIVLVLVAVAVAIGLANPAFWEPANLFGLLRGNIVAGTMALGVLVVLVSGGIDVSFPAFAAAALYLTVLAMVGWGFGGVVLPFAMAAGVGLALGAANAFFVHTLRMVPLIVTLGTGAVVRGFLLGVIGTSVVNVGQMPPDLVAFGRANLVDWAAPDGSRVALPAAVLVYLGLALAVHLLLSRTLAGRGLYALGGDAEAAKRVGFDVRGLTYLAYGLAGALAGTAGLLHASLAWQASPREFIGLELDVLAAVVLGGASIFGGRGSVLGTALGVFLLVLISNSLILLGVPATWQRVAVGVVLIAATAAIVWRERRAGTAALGPAGGAA
jgi:simple sugar transport system permease protein